MLEGKERNTTVKGERKVSVYGECPQCSPLDPKEMRKNFTKAVEKARTGTSTHGRCIECGYQKADSKILPRRKAVV